MAACFCLFTIMSRQLRRILYGLAFLFWLIAITFPFFAIFLAARGQVEIGSPAERHLRVFLVQETEQQGVGVEWARPYRGETPDDVSCLQTRVVYLMWEGEGDNVAYCNCYDAGGGSLPVVDGRCQNLE